MLDFTEDGVLHRDIELDTSWIQAGYKLDTSWIQELQIRHKIKFNYAEMLEGSVISYGGGHHFKRFLKQYCDKDGNRHARIVADPTQEIYLDVKGFEFFGEAPATGVRLAVCDGSFGSMSVHLNQVYLQEAGPFIQKLQGK